MTAFDVGRVPLLASETVLALSSVSKSFVTPTGSQTVLDGVDLTVARGEVLAIAGRSGSGKTTLLTIMAGWEQPDAGSVEFERPANPARRSWSELAILPQSLGLLDELTVAENVTLPLRLDADASGDDGIRAHGSSGHRSPQ